MPLNVSLPILVSRLLQTGPGDGERKRRSGETEENEKARSDSLRKDAPPVEVQGSEVFQISEGVRGDERDGVSG